MTDSISQFILFSTDPTKFKKLQADALKQFHGQTKTTVVNKIAKRRPANDK